MIGLVITTAILGAIALGVIEFAYWLVNERSFIKMILTRHNQKNRLYQCQNCDKLYRRYEIELYKSAHNVERCPHCEQGESYYRKNQERKDIQKWMNIHPDCPKINWLDHMKIKDTMRKLKQNQIDMKHEKFYQEYNKFQVDLSWIENLQKKR